MSRSSDERLVQLLEHSRSLGFLGPGPVEAHLRHARAHAVAAGAAAEFGEVCDLGAGGGVPGLVLAHDFPAIRLTCVDSMRRRTSELRAAFDQLGRSDVHVITQRAEEFARAAPERFSLVVARSFGRPAVTAEIACRLMATGGRLVVSSGPDTVEAWSSSGMEALGLSAAQILEIDGFTFARATKLAATEERYPRRSGMPSKRPLW